MILLANELLDCLPARQFVRTAPGWAERMVGLDDAGAAGLRPRRRRRAALPPRRRAGAVLEMSTAQTAFGAEVGARIAGQGGAALLIDYGRDEPGFGDTLQALKGHRRSSPLATPGEADLTVHADFPAVLAAARAAGAASADPAPRATSCDGWGSRRAPRPWRPRARIGPRSSAASSPA